MEYYSAIEKGIKSCKVDREPEELWIVVHNIIQESVTKVIPKKKKCKKDKWWSEEALQIVVERRERRHSSMNNSNEWRKNRTGKTRNIFNKLGDSKGTFHARMGMIKGWKW